MEKARLLVSVGLATFFLAGCSAKKIESLSIPVSQPAVVMASEPVKRVESVSYSVVRGDTLWGISASQYADPFQWPLIFKANRDQVRDPDLIYPRQIFRVGQDFTPEEKEQAKRVAIRTPKYVPHQKPRRTLPMDYF